MRVVQDAARRKARLTAETQYQDLARIAMALHRKLMALPVSGVHRQHPHQKPLAGVCRSLTPVRRCRYRGNRELVALMAEHSESLIWAGSLRQ